MNKKAIPAVLVIVLLIAATIYFDIFRKMKGGGNAIEGSGTIEVTEIDISGKIAGRVASLPKTEGETVEKGDLLVRLEYDELSAQRNSAAASLANAEKNFRRINELYKSGSVSKSQMDNAETAFRVARANYEQISAAIGNAVILSPIKGIVLDLNLSEGEMAFPGTPVMTVADLSKCWINIYVSAPELALVKHGQAARVFVDGYPGRAFAGRVAAISNRAEFTPKTIQTKDERVKQVFAVKIEADNTDMILKPGMPADAEIIIDTEEKK
jgi:HlyD family secretion protein